MRVTLQIPNYTPFCNHAGRLNHLKLIFPKKGTPEPLSLSTAVLWREFSFHLHNYQYPQGQVPAKGDLIGLHSPAVSASAPPVAGCRTHLPCSCWLTQPTGGTWVPLRELPPELQAAGDQWEGSSPQPCDGLSKGSSSHCRCQAALPRAGRYSWSPDSKRGPTVHLKVCKRLGLER